MKDKIIFNKDLLSYDYFQLLHNHLIHFSYCFQYELYKHNIKIYLINMIKSFV